MDTLNEYFWKVILKHGKMIKEFEAVVGPGKKVETMEGRKNLSIGNEDFRKLRECDAYYVDKTLMIKEFLERRDLAALIIRPRRYGKTLNLTMLREFFDITKDSRELFEGLAIMDTEYADQINSRPVIYFSFKNCKGASVEELTAQLKIAMQEEYGYYEEIFRSKLDSDSYSTKIFYDSYRSLMDLKGSYIYISNAIQNLTSAVYEFYHIRPILLIDEYDQPVMSSYEYGYHNQLGPFFSNLYGSAMKGNPCLDQALITGIQRVVNESIFSGFNNLLVYTVFDKDYAPYFGLNDQEARVLLEAYGMELNDEVRAMYGGYQIYGTEMYNPWSLINYAEKGCLENYWLKTSANFQVKAALKDADIWFWRTFEKLIEGQEEEVWITLETAFAERANLYSLWGLLVNAGYLTVTKRVDMRSCLVKIPNEEVMSEFLILISEISGIDELDLQRLLAYLIDNNMEGFLGLYREMFISCIKYMEEEESVCHLLFLSMCIALRGSYQAVSNLEASYDRSDMILHALLPNYSNVIFEFKQGENLEQLKEEALRQIMDNEYYDGLIGEVLCVGVAYDREQCDIVWQSVSL